MISAETLKRGDLVRYPWPTSTPGHEPPQTTSVVTKTYKDGKSVMVKGSPSIWPVSRVRKV